MTTEENTASNHRYEEQVTLRNLTIEDRTVAYSIAGDPNGKPILFFYPGGGNRRMLVSLHDAAISASLKLLCVNRPGMGGTTRSKESSPAVHTTTTCNDAIHVLDELKVDKVGLLFMCAGAPFALAFACQFPSRVTGNLMGVASWVLPADCKETSSLKRFGAVHCPLWLISPLVGNVMGGMITSFSSMPRSWLLSGMSRKLTERERDTFNVEFDHDEFVHRMNWIFEEKGNINADIKVLLSPSIDIGIDYSRIRHNVVLLHGDKDTMTPVAAAEWLAQQIPSAVFMLIPDGSHEGTMFLLHPVIVQTMKSLGSTSQSPIKRGKKVK